MGGGKGPQIRWNFWNPRPFTTLKIYACFPKRGSGWLVVNNDTHSNNLLPVHSKDLNVKIKAIFDNLEIFLSCVQHKDS